MRDDYYRESFDDEPTEGILIQNQLFDWILKTMLYNPDCNTAEDICEKTDIMFETLKGTLIDLETCGWLYRDSENKYHFLDEAKIAMSGWVK